VWTTEIRVCSTDFMYIRVWEYEVVAEHTDAFVAAYRPMMTGRICSNGVEAAAAPSSIATPIKRPVS